MSDINEIRLKKAMEIEMETLWDCHKHDTWEGNHVKECLSRMLAAYIDDKRNYVVDCAILECDQMSDEPEFRRFHALNARQTANGLRFGVVSDRSCLRDKIEKENMEDGKDVASLRSMGNCKIMRDEDVPEIKKRSGMAKIHGTCYCLMKPLSVRCQLK